MDQWPHRRCGGVVAIDGKTACGSRDGHNSALHTISAYATASGLCLAREHTRGKGNEIPAIKALLDTLTLKRCIVTIDAIGCQTEIARKILDQGGDYLLAVKDNQKPWRMPSDTLAKTRWRRHDRATAGHQRHAFKERAFYIGSKGVTSAASFANAARSH